MPQRGRSRCSGTSVEGIAFALRALGEAQQRVLVFAMFVTASRVKGRGCFGVFCTRSAVAFTGIPLSEDQKKKTPLEIVFSPWSSVKFKALIRSQPPPPCRARLQGSKTKRRYFVTGVHRRGDLRRGRVDRRRRAASPSTKRISQVPRA